MSEKRKQLSMISGVLISMMIVIIMTPSICFAKETQNKTVRVAYALVPGYQEGGEEQYKTGYGYEYLQKLARVNGWKYEYVYGSFNELLNKLKKGEIDLMGNLSYTKERAKKISYGTYEQGEENYCLYVNKNHTTIDPFDYSTIQGKKIGACRGEETVVEWKKWCEKHGITCKVVMYDYFTDCRNALNNGEIDAIIEGNIQLDKMTEDWEVPLKFATSVFYFGVNKNRPDLLKELNEAQYEILEENPFYNEKVQERYLTLVSTASVNLNDKEKNWLKEKGGSIKFGYLKGFLPLCDQDENGNLKGIAADLISAIEQKYEDENITFDSIAYSDYHTMFDALEKGEIDAAWPAYDDFWKAEQSGFSVSDPIVDASMMLIYDGKYTDQTVEKIGVINTGSLPKIYANIYYPQSKIKEYDSYEKAIHAIVTKEISSVLYVSTTYNVDIMKNDELQKLNMTILPDSFGISCAVLPENGLLTSIIDKGIAVFGKAGVNNSLTTNSSVKSEVTLKEYFEEHPYYAVGILTALFLIVGGGIVWYIYHNMLFRVKTSQAEKEVFERLSNSDTLTGLYNRKAVFEKSRRLLKEHPEESFVMAHVDLKHFRLYNTFFGDEAGDQLLCDVADLFRNMSKDYDYWAYGRIEADVFCLFFPYNEKTYIKHFEETIQYLKNYRSDFLMEPALGLYYVTDREMPIEAMFTRAGLASKEVQVHTPYATVIYDEKLERKLNENQQIINDMQEAIDKEQFEVYLQPKYALKTKEMVGSEALVRWMHPEKGMVSPGKFIPVFETNGFITTLDRYMWEHVCQLLSKWKKENKPLIPVSVNVSRLSMFGTSTVHFLKELVQKYDIDPKYLQLELTESGYMDDPEEMKTQMNALKDAGFTILLDDFGSGYSSLNTLRELPVDILKLDMKFLSLDENDVRGNIVISSIVQMSKRLHLNVIAEGVETKKQAQYLTDIDCGVAQGFLFAKPMPVAEYEAILNDYKVL